ncbi:maleylpyruvate isomerase N-terminal domain-containing protein [Actinoplanes sp. NEAU-A12]|uniref:Maleylpyruvate isomerase N-terminal domain-containing protein n=1 Tax=Actinoplanes sandaracinus TaxID=3045177 RepID=A0ABT6WID0_9ACTN|nr:maleylpyruvate isomerase N-terminal domain-containing protein [Actinoplanes sandaracinus]MDI6099474.1 maleylpyruvate isomerase N-terminal domain-containing protein [Actinoplanes sandaracinus]
MVRQDYLDTAAVATTLLADPAVARCWTEPSCLRKFRVCGVAGHLAGQVTQVVGVLDSEPPGTAPVSLVEHYGRSTWTDGDIDSALNTGIRQSGEDTAAAGVTAMHTEVTAALTDLRRRLPAEPVERIIQLPWGPWALTLDDFLTTRMLEIAVHSDDLAVSVGVATPVLPPSALETVLDLLCRWSASRHGGTAVLRALARHERAPTGIAAL